MSAWWQAAKIAALSALAALAAVHWLSPLDSALVGLGVLYLLFVRAG